MIALRLSEGDDLGDSIAHVCRTCDVDSAVIVSAAGMVSSVTFGWYNGRDYNTETVKDIMELASLSGNVSYRGGSLYPHLHGVFNKPDHGAISGHILQAIVFNNAEVFLKPLSRYCSEELLTEPLRPLHRKKDCKAEGPKTGLPLLFPDGAFSASGHFLKVLG